MEYIKEDGIIYEVTKKLVDLDGLKDKLAELKAIGEPTDQELIDEGKAMHPYYENDGEVEKLENTISNIEEDTKVTEKL